MLSRLAESVYWIGRHVERADGTARILDVHQQLLREDPWIEEDSACRSLLAVLGAAAPTDRLLSRTDVLAVLTVDRHDPASIASSLGAARQHARRARELVPTELWDCLDTTRARMPRKVADGRVHEFFAWVRERSALAVGIVESATSHDEVWSFFTLGRSIERAGLTARLLAAPTLTDASGPSWTTILRSCGAYEPYLRSDHGAPAARQAAEFLLLDPRFPRSVLFSISRAEQCLRDVGTSASTDGASGPVAVPDRAEQMLGRARSDLEVRAGQSILEDLTARMEQVQRATTGASEAIRERFFAPSAA